MCYRGAGRASRWRRVYGKTRISTPLTYYLAWVVWIMYNTQIEPHPRTHLCWGAQPRVCAEGSGLSVSPGGVGVLMACRADGGVTSHQLSSSVIAQPCSMAASRPPPYPRYPMGGQTPRWGRAAPSSPCSTCCWGTTTGASRLRQQAKPPLGSHHDCGLSWWSFTHLPLCFWRTSSSFPANW